MKVLIMIAAWAVSTLLVLPTISQGQDSNVVSQAAAAIGDDRTEEWKA